MLLLPPPHAQSGRRAAYTLLDRCKRHPGLHLRLDDPVECLLTREEGGSPSGAETSDSVYRSR